MDNKMNYKTKCYFVENEKVFGDIYVTHQTHESLHVLNNWQIPAVHVQSDRNLTHQTFETPDFMALNRLMTTNGKKQREKVLITSKNNFVNDTNGIQTHNKNRHVKGRLGKREKIHPLPVVRESHEGIVVSSLVDQLLSDIYRYPRSDRERTESESTVSSFRPRLRHRYLQRTRLQLKSKGELSVVLETLQTHINHAGGLLIRQLRRRDYLRSKRDRQYDVITAHLQAYSNKRSMEVRE